MALDRPVLYVLRYHPNFQQSYKALPINLNHGRADYSELLIVSLSQALSTFNVSRTFHLLANST